MALLDRFRTHPGHKNPDAAARLQFVQELPLDERELLTEVAREDGDARVRRAAVAKLMDPGVLAGVARSDADEQVRAQALSMLRDIALEVFEGLGEADSLAAVAAIDDPRTLAGVAKNASRETTAQAALARVADAHARGSIARHSEHESVRRAAFEALQDHGEVLSIALNSEFKDPTLAAVERISDRAELEQIAARAKNKSASKRARAIVREMDERVAADEADARAAAEAAAIAAAAPPVVEPDPEEIARAAERQAESARDAAQRAEADRQAREVRDSAARPRLDLCERIENLQGENALTELEVAAAEWEGMPAVEHPETQEELARRFERAVRACQKRHAEWKDIERRRARLRELAADATRVAALDDLPAARKQFAAIRREWHDLGAGLINDPAVIEEYATAQSAFAARDAAAHDEDQKARREALIRAQQVVGRIEAVASRADLSLKSGERALKDIRTSLSTVPQLPSKKDYDDIVKRLKAAQTALMPKVQELRDVADWQRWANVGIQEQLCEKMEALAAVEDPEAIAKQVRDLQQQWRQAADVPRAQGEALWKRFKDAHDKAWARCEAHFAAQAEARGGNLARKIALCERAEALAESTNWIQTADEIKKLQAEWKTIGAVSRGQEKAIWERFRSACDRFFTRRHADLAERKTVWADNLAKKEALCARAEALKDSTDWDTAATEMKRLQAEWKTIGPVKKTRSEALWQRFRGAADHFFARYAQRHDIALGERVAAREAIVAELEALAGQSPVVSRQSSVEPSSAEPPSADASSGEQSSVEQSSVEQSSGDRSSAEQSASNSLQSAMVNEPPADLMATVRALRGRWQTEIAARGVDRDRAMALDERFARAFAGVIERWPAVFGGSDLDPDANRKKMETIVARIETLAKSIGGPVSAGSDAALSPTARMAAMLKEALAANTIGGKSDDDSRFRAAADDVRQAQAALARVGPVPEQVRRALADRFQRATRRIADVTAQKTAPAQKATGRS
jgi:hypothetical protein